MVLVDSNDCLFYKETCRYYRHSIKHFILCISRYCICSYCCCFFKQPFGYGIPKRNNMLALVSALEHQLLIVFVVHANCYKVVWTTRCISKTFKHASMIACRLRKLQQTTYTTQMTWEVVTQTQTVLCNTYCMELQQKLYQRSLD